MSAGKMNVVILIDFGMTGSAAAYMVTSPWDNFSTADWHIFGKTPTRLLYGNDGKIIAWGNGCSSDNVDNRRLEEGFKTEFANSQLPPTDQSSTATLVSDYLQRYGSSVIDSILQMKHTTAEKLNVTWYLTMPGCWEEPIQGIFRNLAKNALTTIFPGSEVIADINESVASCEFLVRYFQLEKGTWAATCDIGGATCDPALAIIRIEDGVPVPHVFPRAGNGTPLASVKCIDDEFKKLMLKKLKKVLPKDVADMAARLSKSFFWQTSRHSFDGHSDVKLTVDKDLGTWKDPAGDISIDGWNITLSCNIMKSLFRSFLVNLHAEIYKTIKDVRKVAPPNTEVVSSSILLLSSINTKSFWTVIALSGGGGTMVYPLEWLATSFKDIKIKVPGTTEESRLATIKGHGIYRLRTTITKQYLEEVTCGFANEESRATIVWENQMPTPIWKHEFSSGERKLRYYVIVYLRSSPSPKPLSVPTQYMLESNPSHWKGALIWSLDIILEKPIYGKSKYCIEVKCTAPTKFNFTAYKIKTPNAGLVVIPKAYHGGA